MHNDLKDETSGKNKAITYIGKYQALKWNEINFKFYIEKSNYLGQ